MWIKGDGFSSSISFYQNLWHNIIISLLNKLAPLAEGEWKLWPNPLSPEPGTSCSPFCCLFTLRTCRNSSQAFRDLNFCHCWWCFTAEATFCLSLWTCRSCSCHRDQAWRTQKRQHSKGRQESKGEVQVRETETHTHTHWLERWKLDSRKRHDKLWEYGVKGYLRRASYFQKVSFFPGLRTKTKRNNKIREQPWTGSSVRWRIVPTPQGWGFGPWSGTCQRTGE